MFSTGSEAYATDQDISSIDTDRLGYLPIHFVAPRAESLGALLGETFRLFGQNFFLIAKITLVVFGPIQILKSLLLYGSDAQSDFMLVMRVDQFIEGIFGSLVTPALIFALVIVLSGKPAPSLGRSFSWGFRQWGRTFGNRFLAGLAMLGGLLLFIVPGILAAVFFSLIDPIVAIEGDNQHKVLTRSRELVKGHGWTIFFTGLSFLVLFFILGFIVSIPLVLFDTWWINALADLVIDVMYRLFTVVFLLAYLAFSARERIADVFD